VTLIVCAMADLADQAERRRPSGIVSLLNPDQSAPELPINVPWLVLRFNDIAVPAEGLVSPDLDTVARLLTFAAAFPPGTSLLLHCWMGISRSPAAAFILACARNPSRPEEALARALRLAAPSATPNPFLVRLADDRLGRDGRMSAAIARIGRGSEAAVGKPFVLATTP